MKLLDWWWLYYVDAWNFHWKNSNGYLFGNFQNIEAHFPSILFRTSDIKIFSRRSKKWNLFSECQFCFFLERIACVCNCARPPRFILQLSSILSISRSIKFKNLTVSTDQKSGENDDGNFIFSSGVQ
jgi:hypothetical protein